MVSFNVSGGSLNIFDGSNCSGASNSFTASLAFYNSATHTLYAGSTGSFSFAVITSSSTSGSIVNDLGNSSAVTSPSGTNVTNCVNVTFADPSSGSSTAVWSEPRPPEFPKRKDPQWCGWGSGVIEL